MNETNVRNEILDSIDRVDHITLESSLDVLFSLGTAYEKSAMIMEYASDPDEVSMFAIFQEADQPAQPAAEGEAKTEEKPAENTNTTVSANDNAPAANAEAKKKSGILWFIPNLIKKLWQFLKDAWNGVIVPKAEQVSEKAENVFDKIAGKDESWVKEHAAELGLAGGALTAVLAFIAVTRKEEISQKLAEWFAKVKVFFKSMQIAPKLDFDTDSVKTNLAIDKAPNLFQKIGLVYGDSMKAINALKDKNTADPLKVVTDCITAVNSVSSLTGDNIGPLVGDNVTTYTYDDFSAKLTDCVNNLKGDNLPKDETAPSSSDGANLSDEAAKKATVLDGLISGLTKAFFATINFFKFLAGKFAEIFKNRTGAANQIDQQGAAGENAEGTEGEANTEGNEGNAAAAGTENAEQNTAPAEGEAKTEDNTPDYTEEEEAFMKNTFNGQEQSAEEIPEGEETIQESAEDTAISNHWYN